MLITTLTEHSGGGGLITKLYPTLGTPWTAACGAPLSMGFSRQEYWRGLPFPSPVTEYRCRGKKKILSIDVRKSFALMIKPLRKLGREGHFHT